MSNKNSGKYVKIWRRKTKERIISAFGGACCCCGYKTCPEALELHHLNPNEKEFGFGAIRANPKNWQDMVIELRKCVLICSNCHREVHANVKIIPLDANRFDEKFNNYKHLESLNKIDKLVTPCVICGRLKPEDQFTCSKECSNKRKGTIKWELYDLVDLYVTQKKTPDEIAILVGCSDMAVRKRLDKLGLYTLVKK